MRNKKEDKAQQDESKKEIKVEQETEDIYPINNNEIKKEYESEEIKETRLDEEDSKEAETCSNSASSSIVTEEDDEDEVRIFNPCYILLFLILYFLQSIGTF
jgi:hypothetical protein